MDFASRDTLIAAFRREVYKRARFIDDTAIVTHRLATGYVWYPHQAEWQLATEGWTLLDQAPAAGQFYTIVAVPDPEDLSGKAIRHEHRRILPRQIGTYTGAADVAADLAAYKSGKSFGMGAYLTGYAIVPDADVQFIGAQYDTSEPEFTYLCDFLCSERGMNMKPAIYQNDKRAGRMRLVLHTGAKFEVKTWERKESLKGKRVDCYCYTECYQLPGLECFTTVAQNLREKRGKAIFGTTADRPWVQVFHDYGHGRDPKWHCTCGIDAQVNPVTYDQTARDRDNPDKGGIMTRERYAIAWQGKLGSFVGRVYDYARGQRALSPLSHPLIWNDRTLMALSEAERIAAGIN